MSDPPLSVRSSTVLAATKTILGEVGRKEHAVMVRSVGDERVWGEYTDVLGQHWVLLPIW
ncbi:hypothetical protein [Natronorubrum halophilum]|uniref:hypothetical protein n=1 Tax=Natronorubrum halophilum TaxID=1702106 RepID=UPI0013CEDDBD|nr:hypothetical protein [Natronorubrum halophilum]